MKMLLIFLFLFSSNLFAFPQDFKIFNNQYEAYRFVVNKESTGVNPLKVHSLDFFAYEKAQRIIDEVMDGFYALYPNLTYNLPVPYPILIKEKSLNAFVYSHTTAWEGAPWVIMIFSEMFYKNIPEDEIVGVIAHELSHLLFEHSKKEVIDNLEIYYYVDPQQEEPLGYRQQNHPEVKKIVTDWIWATKMKKNSVVNNLKSNYHVNSFRVYSTEEQADDTSIRVLDYINRDPLGIGKFMLRWLSESARQKCLLMIERGEQIPYGSLLRKHRPDCWRFDHAMRLAEIL